MLARLALFDFLWDCWDGLRDCLGVSSMLGMLPGMPAGMRYSGASEMLTRDFLAWRAGIGSRSVSEGWMPTGWKRSSGTLSGSGGAQEEKKMQDGKTSNPRWPSRPAVL